MTLPPRKTVFSRNMRNRPTHAEYKVWSFLKNRKLGGYKFRRQAVVSSYILDFYCPELRLAVELDGNQHTLPEHAQYDYIRTDRLAQMGIQIMRFPNISVLKEGERVAHSIWNKVQEIEKEREKPANGL